MRTAFTVVFILGLMLGAVWMTGCGPSRSRPETVPFPQKLGRQWPGGIIGINQARCFGGGIGGCSLSGKAQGGPTN